MQASGGVGSKSELLNVLGDVKARVQDKLGIVDFPMPQFILIGKQSVGKSRLIEALAGETFNFISGTLGSRRPTVLEFRNVAAPPSRWYVRDRKTNQWGELPVQQVMKFVGAAHEELGETVSAEPIYVRIESPMCVDMQIVDLPGFRDFALDSGKQVLADKIVELVMTFMRDKHNVMLCVEQAADAATMSTLQKCREIDPNFERTILIRNKLDKYYNDLTTDNVNKWVDGFGDLPQSLIRFAVTLPWWRDGAPPPKPFNDLKEDMNMEDLRQMQAKGLSAKYMQTIGFRNFTTFMEKKIEQMFVDAMGPVLQNLKDLKTTADNQVTDLQTEYNDTDPHRILSTTRDCGVSFATALTHVMEGVLDLSPVMNLEEELREFHAYHQALGSNHFAVLPSEDFCGLNDYIEYLRNEIQIATFDVEVNGGAQFRRLMNEVEIFLRFSEIAVETKKRDVIQARGVSMSSLTWRDVVVKLLKLLKYDGDNNQYLDPQEFKLLMEDLQQRPELPKYQVYLFLAEADMNADGVIEYEEFIPLVLQSIQGMYAKRRLEQHMSNFGQHTEDLLVHGMSRDELTDLVSSIVERMDQDRSGSLCRQKAVAALTSMELGLTRREINTIIEEADGPAPAAREPPRAPAEEAAPVPALALSRVDGEHGAGARPQKRRRPQQPPLRLQRARAMGPADAEAQDESGPALRASARPAARAGGPRTALAVAAFTAVPADDYGL